MHACIGTCSISLSHSWLTGNNVGVKLNFFAAQMYQIESGERCEYKCLICCFGLLDNFDEIGVPHVVSMEKRLLTFEFLNYLTYWGPKIVPTGTVKRPYKTCYAKMHTIELRS
jgi:hypothetical protein